MSRLISLASGVLPVEVSLFFEDMHHASDGHRGGRIGQGIADLVDGGVAASKEDLHDLAFAAGEVLCGIGHGARAEEFRSVTCLTLLRVAASENSLIF